MGGAPLELFRFTTKGGEFSYAPPPPHAQPFHTIRVPGQSGASVTAGAPAAFPHHHHPESAVCVRVHAWWCTYYVLGQMYNDIHVVTVIVSFQIMF